MPVCPVNNLIRHLTYVTTFGCTTKYVAYPKIMKGLKYELNLKRLPDLKTSTKDSKILVMQTGKQIGHQVQGLDPPI